MKEARAHPSPAGRRRWMSGPGILAAALFLLLSLATGSAFGQTASTPLADALARLKGLEERIAAGTLENDVLDGLLVQGAEIRSFAVQCSTTTQRDLTALKARIGSDQAQDDPTLSGRVSSLEARAAECRSLGVRADALVKTITDLQQRQLVDFISERRSNILVAAVAALQDEKQWFDLTRHVAERAGGGLAIGLTNWAILATFVLVGAALGWRLRVLLGSARRGRLRGGKPRYALIGALIAASGYFLMRATTLAAPPPAVMMIWIVTGTLFAVLVIDRVMARPADDADGREMRRSLSRRLKVFAAVFAVNAAFRTLTIDFEPTAAWQLTASVLRTLVIANAIWANVLVDRLVGRGATGRGFRFAINAVLMILLLADWAGYRNFTDLAMRGLVGTGVCFLIYTLINSGLQRFFDGLESGSAGPQRALRNSIGLREGDPVPGLVWIRIAIGLTLIALLSLGILAAWNLVELAQTIALDYAVDGFNIGGVHVVPASIVTGLVIFAILIAVVQLFRSRVVERLVRGTPLDAGARDALVSVTGYVGFVVAAVIALGWAGISFENVAIVAGALSVGIGFGLQNVVSNFVSGLILLFERPIRPGDWVVVGGTEGFVKKVRVRATEIQTFDRADVIVPNADFISAQVTNHTLRDYHGRVIVSIGVAYGSDTGLVRTLLLEMAKKHPAVLDGPLVPAPMVLFSAFGDSALLFELRIFIRDIRQRFLVQSDLHFAIDEAFRRESIEIAFPQMDIHIRRPDKGNASAPPPTSLD